MLTCFLPCRAGSERVPRKNTRPFAGSSLIQIKLGQLTQARLIDQIIVSTDDPEVMDIAGRHGVKVHVREPSLCESGTSTDELIAHAADLIPEGDILWTHVTSPFVDARLYDEMISIRKPLMAVTPIRGFLWRNGPFNYCRDDEKWPRTQTIEPVYEINSAAFIAPVETYRAGDRITEDPYLFELGPITGMDIDWMADFVLAECAFENGLRNPAG